MPPCCQPGLCSELCLCTGPCVIYFPREDQLRWRIRASAELSFSFFFFFLFKRNQANPHIERKIVPFGCCLVRLTGTFERHSVSAEGVDSGLCRSPGTPPSPRLFLWSSWVGMGGAGLQKAEAKDARRWAGPASKRPSPGRFLLGVQSPCLFCPCQEEVPTCRRHPLLQHPSASSTRAPYEHFSRPSGK